MARRRRKPKRRGYVRPSRARKHPGWSLRELARLTEVSERTLRLYRERGVLPPSPFKGAATRYQRSHLLWVLGVRRGLQEGLTLAQIRPRLQSMRAPELEAFATERLAPGPAMAALGLAPPAPSPHLTAAPPEVPLRPRWTRIELALGLELHLRDDAAPAARELALRIRQMAPVGSEA